MLNDNAVTLFLTYAFPLVLAAFLLPVWPIDQHPLD
jgi:hypothetical protein